MNIRTPSSLAAAFVGCAVLVSAQVDERRALEYFKEADALCQRDGGRLWGVSLCGPMVIADAATKTVATNRPAPSAPRPAALGYANAAMTWGEERWSTFVWPLMPADKVVRGRLMMHELFHRVQPQLGLLLQDSQSEHLDTVDGRFWMVLEWRALARALGASGRGRNEAISDAIAFRTARRGLFPASIENERVLEINEGLAQYTGTVTAVAAADDAVADAIRQLADAEASPTYVRSFPYPSGAGYGVLLDAASPGWPRRVKATDDLGSLLQAATGVIPAADAGARALTYGSVELRAAEELRAVKRAALVADLRQKFVLGPVLVCPASRNTSFISTGMTSIPGHGMVYPTLRATAEWGTLEAAQALMAPDRSRITVPAPSNVTGSTITGPGYVLTLAPGWVVRPGTRAGDFEVIHSGR